jgi:choline transport protein
MPIYELWTQATNSVAAGTAFLALIYVLTVMVLVGTTETSSRITWSLARDDAFYGSAYLSHVHPTLKVPVWSIVANTVACAVMGCLYLASTTGECTVKRRGERERFSSRVRVENQRTNDG